jgi:hypothetical protein
MHFRTYLADDLTLVIEWMDRNYVRHETKVEFDLTPLHNTEELNIKVNNLMMITDGGRRGLSVTEVSQETGELITR